MSRIRRPVAASKPKSAAGRAVADRATSVAKSGAKAAPRSSVARVVKARRPAHPAGSDPQRADVAASQDDCFHLVVLDHFSDDAAAPGRSRSRPQFVRLFASYAGARVSVPMRVRSAPGARQTRFPDIIATHQRIRDYTSRERGSLPDDAALIEFGSDLFETLFQGDVRRLYDEARARQRGRCLDLVLTSMVPWIAEKPWEFAYDRSRQRFLATEDIHFVRNVLTAVPAEAIAPEPGPLRILVVSAQPLDMARLSISQETTVIRRGFQRLVDAGLASVEVLARATPASLHQTLQTGRFSVVHFIGHGVFDEATQEGALVFEDARRNQHLLGQRAAREILCQRGVRLVFLNACQTGTGGTGEFNKGIAQALVAHGLPALVANQYSVLDTSATGFARQFYASLARGMSLGAAAREARIALNYALQGEAIDWAIPVVYARDPGLRLCDSAMLQRTATPPRRRSVVRSSSRFQIAFWDVDGAFPALPATLRAMQAAQPMFGFAVVQLSMPVGSWDLQHRAADGRPYLWAERMAEQMAAAALDLQADALFCLTRQWLRDDRHLDREAWWPKHTQPAVLLASCAGVEQLPVAGRPADRLLVNRVTTALAGYLAGVGLHARGPSSCPLAANPERTLAQWLGPQRFDARCRRALQLSMGDRLDALESLSMIFARNPRRAR